MVIARVPEEHHNWVRFPKLAQLIILKQLLFIKNDAEAIKVFQYLEAKYENYNFDSLIGFENDEKPKTK